MEYIITERQYRLISEQAPPTLTSSNQKSSLQPTTNVKSGTVNSTLGPGQPLDKHTLLTILQIGTAFIPVAGPFISAGIGLADAGLYYKEGDKTTAGVTAAFSMIPFLGPIVSKIPGVKQLGSKGMAALGAKIARGSKNLTQAEIEIANAVKFHSAKVQEMLKEMAPRLTKVMKEINLYKPNFIKKYGQEKYDRLLVEYLYGMNNPKNKVRFINTLKNVKNPTLQVKPMLGGGSDHMVFQSVLKPNMVFKAELRPGEVEKWYNLFKKHPKIFANPSKIVKVKGSNGEILNAVAIEKLNTQPFMQLWEDLTQVGGKLKTIPIDDGRRGLETVLKNLRNVSNKEKWNNIVIAAKKQYPNLSRKIDEFNNMIDELYKITPNPDIRQYNLGYDTNGLLKALDI
jgi:hypothetical protein